MRNSMRRFSWSRSIRTSPVLHCLVLLASQLFVVSRLPAQDRYTPLRERMVDEFIAAEGVTNPKVLTAMRTVPRHLFVRPDLRQAAYFDQALDIGYKQTISPPFIVAYMTETLDPQPTDKVLEIGTGSGYQAAVLSGLVDQVYTIEIVEPLGQRAASLLKRLGYDNVHAKVGDGYLGWPEVAPFDKIIVTCSPESVPQPLVDQLREGGRMIIPLGERYQQVFHLLEKKDGKLEKTQLIPTLFVPMTGTMEELRQKKPDPANPQLVNGGFEEVTVEEGLADGWHYQRRSTLTDDANNGAQSIRFDNQEQGRMAHMLQAFAIDGREVPRLRVNWSMKSQDIYPGRNPQEQPGIIIYFFDERRIPFDRAVVATFGRDEPVWTAGTRQIDIPRGAREAIIQAGLNGGTGRIWFDDISIIPAK